MQAALDDVAGDEARDGAEEREVEDDSPGGLLHVAELLHLPVDDEVEERDAQTDEGRDQLALVEARLQHDGDAREARDRGEHERPRRGLVAHQGEDHEVGGHEERRRVDEGHVGPEVHLSEREEPEHDRERAEDGTLDVARDVRGLEGEGSAVAEDEEGDHEHAEERAVEDHFDGAVYVAAELDECRHDGKERRSRQRPKGLLHHFIFFLKTVCGGGFGVTRF